MKKDYDKQIETMKKLTLEEIRQRIGEKVWEENAIKENNIEVYGEYRLI